MVRDSRSGIIGGGGGLAEPDQEDGVGVDSGALIRRLKERSKTIPRQADGRPVESEQTAAKRGVSTVKDFPDLVPEESTPAEPPETPPESSRKLPPPTPPTPPEVATVKEGTVPSPPRPQLPVEPLVPTLTERPYISPPPLPKLLVEFFLASGTVSGVCAKVALSSNQCVLVLGYDTSYEGTRFTPIGLKDPADRPYQALTIRVDGNTYKNAVFMGELSLSPEMDYHLYLLSEPSDGVDEVDDTERWSS